MGLAEWDKHVTGKTSEHTERSIRDMFERQPDGRWRINGCAVQADTGVQRLKEKVDTLIVIPNQNLFLIANPNTTFKDAFKMADEVLQQGVRGITI